MKFSTDFAATLSLVGQIKSSLNCNPSLKLHDITHARYTHTKLFTGRISKLGMYSLQRYGCVRITSWITLVVNFPFLDGDVPRHPSFGVYIHQLIRFARVCSHVDDYNTRNKCLTAKFLKQGYQYHKLRKVSSNFYRRHYELISKFNVGLNSLLHQGLKEPEFYGDLVYKFKKIRGMTDFSDQFFKEIYIYNALQTYWLYSKYNATVCMLGY